MNWREEKGRGGGERKGKVRDGFEGGGGSE